MTDKIGTEANLIKAVDSHLKMLNEAIKCSEQISKYAVEGDFQRVEAETMNRERLINIVGYVQGRIERAVKIIPPSVYNDKIAQTLNNWQEETSKAIKRITDIDTQVMELLKNSKQEVTKELGSVYKNKESHKGYNLNNVKR